MIRLPQVHQLPNAEAKCSFARSLASRRVGGKREVQSCVVLQATMWVLDMFFEESKQENSFALYYVTMFGIDYQQIYVRLQRLQSRGSGAVSCVRPTQWVGLVLQLCTCVCVCVSRTSRRVNDITQDSVRLRRHKVC
jgi:hypothetical protein